MLSILIFSLAIIVTVSCYNSPNTNVLPPYNKGTSDSSSTNGNAYLYNKQSSGSSLNGFGSQSVQSPLVSPRGGNGFGNGGGGGGPEANAKILKQSQNIDPDGTYFYEFETDNGISVHEEGQPRDLGNNEIAMTVNGRFSYTAPDGQLISLTYVADENGFQPQGAHLPTPPPIPEAIQRAIQYIQTHGGGQQK